MIVWKNMDSFDKPVMICHVEKAVSYTLYDCKWIPKTAKFVVIGSEPRGTGIIEVFEVGPTDINSILKIQTKSALKCGTFGAVPKGTHHLATGDFTGNLQIWDIDTGKNISEVKGHGGIINCIDGVGGTTKGPPEIATGSRDGTVKIWDVRQIEKAVTTIEPQKDEVKRDCWAVCFGNCYNDDERMLCAGYDNGDVKLFDLKGMTLLWETNLKNGICGLEFDRRNIEINKLVATTLESKFHVFDCRTLHPEKGFTGMIEKAHNSTIWVARHLPQNRDVFITTGGNGGLCLWKYVYPSKRIKVESDGTKSGVTGTLELLQNNTLSTQPISAFDWCADKIGLAIGVSFDQCIRLFIVTKLNLL